MMRLLLVIGDQDAVLVQCGNLPPAHAAVSRSQMRRRVVTKVKQACANHGFHLFSAGSQVNPAYRLILRIGDVKPVIKRA